MSHAALMKGLWWLCLLVAPLVLVGLELFHPAGFTHSPGMYKYLSAPQPYDAQFKALAYWGPEWWFALHMIQTPMVALVAVGLWQIAALTDRSASGLALALAWLGRVATFVFLIYYTALDSIGGSGLGRSIINSQTMGLTADQLSGAVLLLDRTWVDPWVGGVGSFISLTGSWAAFLAALFVALALLVDGRVSWPPALLLAGFGWELQMSHTMPHGPIAFALLILAGIWMRRTGRGRLVDAHG
jgi:hypothetical protein